MNFLSPASDFSVHALHFVVLVAAHSDTPVSHEGNDTTRGEVLLR